MLAPLDAGRLFATEPPGRTQITKQLNQFMLKRKSLGDPNTAWLEGYSNRHCHSAAEAHSTC